MCSCDVGAFFPILHLSTDHAGVPRPAESHRAFGAGFILLGSILASEGLAGGVWFRSRVRALILPATLVFLGSGMLAVTTIEPQARVAHFAMGLPMLIGGWAEARARLGSMARTYADVLIVLALLFAAFETAAYHLSGEVTSGIYLTHASLAATAVLIAGLRLYQGLLPTSLARCLLVSVAVLAVGVELYVDAVFQPSL